MTPYLIALAVVTVVLIGWGLSPVERKHRHRKHGKPRRPAAEVEVPLRRRISLREMLADNRPVIRTAKVQGVHQTLSGDYDSRDLPGRFDPHYAWLARQARCGYIDGCRDRAACQIEGRCRDFSSVTASAGELDPGAPWCPGCGFANYSAGPCEVCGHDDQNVPRPDGARRWPASEATMPVLPPATEARWPSTVNDLSGSHRPGHPRRWPMPLRVSGDLDDTLVDLPPRLCAGRNPAGDDPFVNYLLTSNLDGLRSGAWL